MLLSLKWIRDYVALPEDLEMSRLAYDLTMSTVEVEGTEDLARRFDHMVLGRIAEILPHPNADALRICRVDLGDRVTEIVCGGSNLAPEQKVAACSPLVVEGARC